MQVCWREADVVKCAKIRLELFVAEFCSGPALTATTLRNTSARKPPALAASGPCKTLASKLGTRRSRLSIVQFANSPKRSMGHVLGAEKSNFLFRRAEADDATGRPCRFNPVNPCQTGLPEVA